jgi:DNA-binding MarR family transcriptional regulator
MSSVPSPGLAHLLSHAERRLGLRMTAVLAEEDCSVEQWRVLSIIADGKGHPMTEIADQALMPAPSLTKLVDRMVADNLVHRRPDRADRRRVLLHLTARGRTLHQRAARRLLADQTPATSYGCLPGSRRRLTGSLRRGRGTNRSANPRRKSCRCPEARCRSGTMTFV